MLAIACCYLQVDTKNYLFYEICFKTKKHFLSKL